MAHKKTGEQQLSHRQKSGGMVPVTYGRKLHFTGIGNGTGKQQQICYYGPNPTVGMTVWLHCSHTKLLIGIGTGRLVPVPALNNGFFYYKKK
jgi:hypothetical protein